MRAGGVTDFPDERAEQLAFTGTAEQNAVRETCTKQVFGSGDRDRTR